MNQRLLNLHNKTQAVPEEELPYNPTNVLLQESDLQAFFDTHGLKQVAPRNLNLYRNAFVHRSYCTMKKDDFEEGNRRCPEGCLPLQEMSYERLEFLGDAILGMIVARYLYERYPDQHEGFLSRMRTKIVNGKMLGELADKIGFPKFAIMSKQIEDSQGRSNYKIMEDIFEAFLGAIYEDFQTPDDDVTLPRGMPFAPLSGAGYHVAEQWVVSVMEKYLDFADLVQARTNFKESLGKYMMAALKDSPRFFEANVTMRDGVKHYTVCVKDKAGGILGTAAAASRKDAENMAAKAALVFYGQSVV